MNHPAREIWSKVLVLLEKDLTPTTINTWFSEALAVCLEPDRLVIHIPDKLKQEIVITRYAPFIKAALKDIFSADMDLLVLTGNELDFYKSPTEEEKQDGTTIYTFDRFVVGSSNKFAYAASCAVAEKPGNAYNPLYIYGKSGLGKTHLLHAIAQQIKHDHPTYRIIYIKGDTFTNEMVAAIREGKSDAFRAKFRSCDVFLMDDVQFIAGKDTTMEEMFHTFNTLFDENKQIVFTADRPPREMLKLTDRLKTRFEWGVTCDIQPPDYETRVAIIKNKCIRMGIELPDFLLEMIAENITANVRQIEGIVNKITAYQDLLGAGVSKETVIRAVKDMFKQKSEIIPTADVIIEEVCLFFTIPPEALRGHGRTKTISFSRQICMYLIRTMTNLSLKDIGREFEGRDHTTVLHAIDRIEEKMKEHAETAEIIKDIVANINSHYE